MPKYLKLRGASTSLNMEGLVLIGASINKGYEKYPQRPIISIYPTLTETIQWFTGFLKSYEKLPWVPEETFF